MKVLNKHMLKEYGACRSHFSYNVTSHRKVFMAHKGNLLPGERSLSLHGTSVVLNKGLDLDCSFPGSPGTNSVPAHAS